MHRKTLKQKKTLTMIHMMNLMMKTMLTASLKKKKAKAKKAPITQVMSDNPIRKFPSPPEEVENLIQQL